MYNSILLYIFAIWVSSSKYMSKLKIKHCHKRNQRTKGLLRIIVTYVRPRSIVNYYYYYVENSKTLWTRFAFKSESPTVKSGALLELAYQLYWNINFNSDTWESAYFARFSCSNVSIRNYRFCCTLLVSECTAVFLFIDTK